MLNEIRQKTEELEGNQRKLLETSIFLGKMLTAGAFFHLILSIYPNTTGLQAILADITQKVLSIFGVNLEQRGIQLIDSDIAYVVTQDCLGWKSMAAYSALIFSSTKDYKNNLKPFIAGILVIAVINVVRISTTIYLSHLKIISFDIIHAIFWKWGLTALVILLWLFWLHKISGE